MTERERVILIIEDYILDLTRPCKNWTKEYFCKISYQRWAGNEILNLVRRNPTMNPIDVIGDFSKKKEAYLANNDNNELNRQIFNIAYEMATDILEIIRSAS